MSDSSVNSDTAAKVGRRHTKRSGRDSTKPGFGRTSSNVTVSELKEGGVRIDKKLGRRANNLDDALAMLEDWQELYFVYASGRRARRSAVHMLTADNTPFWKKTRNLKPGIDFELYVYPAVKAEE